LRWPARGEGVGAGAGTGIWVKGREGMSLMLKIRKFNFGKGTKKTTPLNRIGRLHSLSENRRGKKRNRGRGPVVRMRGEHVRRRGDPAQPVSEVAPKALPCKKIQLIKDCWRERNILSGQRGQHVEGKESEGRLSGDGRTDRTNKRRGKEKSTSPPAIEYKEVSAWEL